MLQTKEPKDYVIGTGASDSVNDFLLATMAAMADLGLLAMFPRNGG